MNMKMPDFNMKKLVKEAGSHFSRVVQVNKISSHSHEFDLDQFHWFANEIILPMKWRILDKIKMSQCVRIYAFKIITSVHKTIERMRIEMRTANCAA